MGAVPSFTLVSLIHGNNRSVNGRIWITYVNPLDVFFVAGVGSCLDSGTNAGIWCSSISNQSEYRGQTINASASDTVLIRLLFAIWRADDADERIWERIWESR